MDELTKAALYQLLLEQLKDALARRDTEQVSAIVRLLRFLDPETTDRLIDALIEIGLRRITALVG